MPSASEHQIKASHNRAFLNSITDPAFCDWMAVAAFYTAVHLVEQLFPFRVFTVKTIEAGIGK